VRQQPLLKLGQLKPQAQRPLAFLEQLIEVQVLAEEFVVKLMERLAMSMEFKLEPVQGQGQRLRPRQVQRQQLGWERLQQPR
jgi:hypothetical protein